MSQDSYLMQNYARSPLSFIAGEGAYLTGDDGKRYLDFSSGIAVNALGHAHPYLLSVLSDAMKKPWHLSNAFTIPEQEKLGRRLCENSFADRAFFCNSGVEALEASFKLARRYFYDQGQPNKYRIISVTGAFHGRSLAAIAATGNAAYLEGFGPKTDGFDQVPFGNLNHLRDAIGDETAAILIEPVQGEGGLEVASDQLLADLRAICDEFNLLLIYDEVQCGNARTGKYWAFEHSGVAPDILATAKGLGGGFPIGAILAREAVAASFIPGTHGTTFGGNPLAMAVGNAVLDVIETDAFMAHINDTASCLNDALAGLVQDFPNLFTQIRGRGLMRGLGLKAPHLAKDMVAALRDKGLLCVAAGSTVIRLLPPLIINQEHVSKAESILRQHAQSL